MIEITDKEIDRLARLSHLKFTAEEKEEVRKKLESTISMLDKCQEAEVEELEHTNRVAIADLREDVALDSMPQEEVLLNAPKQRRGYFNVPKVVD